MERSLNLRKVDIITTVNLFEVPKEVDEQVFNLVVGYVVVKIVEVETEETSIADI